jgi:perosamine synthetase
VIAVNAPLLDDHDLKYVAECVRTGWISSAGRFIESFEARWASYCGRRHGVAVSSGTAALQLAVACLNLRPGDEVIIPTFTIISCALAVIYNGARPVLVDAEPRTWTMDVENIEALITPRTRAIMAVHIYGHPVSVDALLEVAERHGLAVIEDAAEAHGAEYLTRRVAGSAWRRCGSVGLLSVFSFYANKPITTGEGGMLLTDDDCVAARARSLRNLCFARGQRFVHEELGHNFRMTNMQAALGLAQTERVDAIVSRKREIASLYLQLLHGIPGVRLPVEELWARNVYWMFGLILDDGLLDAAQVAAALLERGIETRPFFVGMHAQPALLRAGHVRPGRYPVADRLAERGLYLPSGLATTNTQIEEVCAAVREVLA